MHKTIANTTSSFDKPAEFFTRLSLALAAFLALSSFAVS
jgi:hypothetical protein